MERSPREEQRRKERAYLRYSSAGMQLAITVGLGVWAGLWADGKLGTSPILVVVGTFLGFGAGFYSLYMSLFGRRR